jgi:hypothetical protein
MGELRVLAREVPAQELPAGVDEERQVAHGQTVLAVRDHGRKRVCLRLGEQRGAIVESECGGQVHGRPSRLDTNTVRQAPDDLSVSGAAKRRSLAPLTGCQVLLSLRRSVKLTYCLRPGCLMTLPIAAQYRTKSVYEITAPEGRQQFRLSDRIVELGEQEYQKVAAWLPSVRGLAELSRELGMDEAKVPKFIDALEKSGLLYRADEAPKTMTGIEFHRRFAAVLETVGLISRLPSTRLSPRFAGSSVADQPAAVPCTGRAGERRFLRRSL